MSTYTHSPGPWHTLLLEQSLQPNQQPVLAQQVQDMAREFLAQTNEPPTAAEVQAADAWYLSTEGQQCLKALVSETWARMKRHAPNAMPAHDERHAMYKVPAAALAHLQAEQVAGHERVGVLGALLHDYGRWAEERIYGGPGDSVLHARFSFLLAQELVTSYDMPLLVTNRLLAAPLQHTSGAVPTDDMPLKLTVSADRDQLYGPEFVIRIAHHSINDKGDGASFYGEKPGLPILARLHRMYLNRLPGPLFARDAHVRNLRDMLGQFILLCENVDASRSRWTLDRPSAAQLDAPLSWADSWHAAQALPHLDPSDSARLALARLLSAKHVAPGARHWVVALDKVSHVPSELEPRLVRALDWVHHCRVQLDEAERISLIDIKTEYAADALVSTLAEFLLD